MNENFILIRRYDAEGHTKGVPEFKPPKPIRLQWDFPDPAVEAIEKSYKVPFFFFLDYCEC